MLFFPQLLHIPACNRPTTWSLLPFCLVSPKRRQLPLVWAGAGDSARTEHAPLSPQPSLEHPIHAKTPLGSPRPAMSPLNQATTAHPLRLRGACRHFERCLSGPPRGRPSAEAAPGGVPQPPGVPRAPRPGSPRWGCGAAGLLVLRLSGWWLRVVLPGLLPRQLVCRLPCPVVSLSGGALASGALVVFVG